MRRALAVVLALLSLPLAAPAAPGPAPVEARGPDEDGGWILSYDIHLAAEAGVALRLDVARDDAGDVLHAERDLGVRRIPAGTTRIEAPFLPAEGAGEYAVALVADGVAGEPLRFVVNETGGAGTRVAWTVPDEPTTLRLADDPVNADGKLKSPGEAVVTRAILDDGNGVRDIHALRWFVLHGGVVVDEGALPLDAPPNATRLLVEHRHARSPLAAGEHALLLRAVKNDAPAAEVRRTFLVRDVAPTLVSLRVPNVIPDETRAHVGEIVLADRNGWGAAPPLEVRLYRGSARLDGRTMQATLGDSSPLPDADGAARVALPLLVEVPAGAAPGKHRASVYLNGSLLGSAPFEVLPLPRLAWAAAVAEPDALALRVNLTAPGLLDVAIRGGDGLDRATHALPAGPSLLRLPLPSPEGDWNVTLRAREGGPALGAAGGEYRLVAPPLHLHPLRAPPRLPAVWRVEAPGWDLAGAEANATLTRWDGAVVPASATFAAGNLTLGAKLEPGRYTLDLELRLPNGSRGRATLPFDVAPWVRVVLGEPATAGGEARVPLRNAGAPLRGVVVEIEGLDATPRLIVGDRAFAPRVASGRHVFDAPLATDEEATLLVPLPQGPQPSGTHAARVRVLALGARA